MTALAVRAVTLILGLFGINLSGFAAGAILFGIATVAIGGGVTWWTAHWYNSGYETADNEWKAKELQAEIEKANDDRNAAQRAEGVAKLRVEAILEQSKKDKDADAKYIEELSKRPAAAACNLTDADRRGMRDSKAGGADTSARPSGISRWIKPPR